MGMSASGIGAKKIGTTTTDTDTLASSEQTQTSGVSDASSTQAPASEASTSQLTAAALANNVGNGSVSKTQGDLTDTSTSESTLSTDLAKFLANSSSWSSADVATRKKLEDENAAIRAKYGWTINSSTGKTYDANGQLINSSYTSGSTTGGQSSGSIPAGAKAQQYYYQGQMHDGYIKDNLTYDMQGNRIPTGSVVKSATGQSWFLTVDGSLDASKLTQSTIWREEKDETTGKYKVVATGEAFITKDGKAYDKKTGQRVSVGDIIKGSDGRRWIMTETGKGVLFNESEQTLPMTDYEEYLWNQLEEIIGNKPTLDNILTWYEAQSRARSIINPEFEKALSDLMKTMDESSLKSGFYGQLPTESLKRQTAASLEYDKLKAIYDLAMDLQKQSEDSAYKKYDAESTAQNNSVNQLMKMIEYLSSQYKYDQEYEDSRADVAWEQQYKLNQQKLDALYQKASMTGDYEGVKTLDYWKLKNEQAQTKIDRDLATAQIAKIYSEMGK